MSLGSVSAVLVSMGAMPVRAWLVGTAALVAPAPLPAPVGLAAPHLRHADLVAQFPGQAHSVH
eukprot:1027875-Lingulodinium_polyedra.AAC.1